MCMFDNGNDVPRVYRETVVTARKPHKCGECRREIAPGERYQYVFGVWDYVGSERTCEHCLVAQEWLREECDGWLFCGIYEDLMEHIIGAGPVFSAREGYGSRPARLVVGMRRKWKSFSGNGLMRVPAL